MQTSAPFLTGAPAECSFALTDHHGRDVTDADYRGRFLLVYFGFTHCRVVCPRALARLSEALSLLDELADRIQPLYVTVDPVRDTPAVMKAYLETAVSALHRSDWDARAGRRRQIAPFASLPNARLTRTTHQDMLCPTARSAIW